MKKNVIPMAIPTVGQQPQFDARQVVWKKCKCGAKLFEKAVRVGMISKLSTGNRTGIDIPAEAIVYVCRDCGKPLDMLVESGELEFIDKNIN